MALVPAFLGLRRPAYQPAPKAAKAVAAEEPAADRPAARHPVAPIAAAPGPAGAAEPAAPSRRPRRGVSDAVARFLAEGEAERKPPSAEEMASRRRWGRGRDPKLIDVHRRLSDAYELWRTCRSPACRRARACSRSASIACVYEQRETMEPHLPELSRKLQAIAKANGDW